MLNLLSELDSQLLLAVNSFHTGAFDQFMWIISSKMIWVPLYAVILVLLIHRYGWRAGCLVTAGAILAVAMADQSCATFIRPFVGRLRPANPDNPIAPLVHILNDYRGGRYGFPSCHAANTFAFATFMSLVFRPRKLVWFTLFGWALLNCWSRMYLGVHYPGDLIAGGLVGAFCGWLSFRMFMWLIDRMVMHRAPREAVRFRIGFASVSELSVGTDGIVAFVGFGTSLIVLTVSVLSYLI